jgi:hypothetical protein
MLSLTKHLNIESPSLKPICRRSHIKYLPKHVLQPRKSRYSRGLLNYPQGKQSSYSPVSSINYKDFSLISLVESLPQKSKKRRLPQDQENPLQPVPSKLQTYSILPPVRRSADYLNDNEKSISKAGHFKLKKSYNQYRPKVFLPVLKQKCGESKYFKVRMNFSELSSPLEVDDDCKINAWERSDSS